MRIALRSMELLFDIIALDPELQDEVMIELVTLDVKRIFLLVNYTFAEQGARGDKQAWSPQASMDALKRYLESHYQEKITLRTLCQIVNLSKPHLIRLFKNETGVTPFQYLDELRLHAATSYLANTALTMQEIADLTGYSSIHFFSRRFKQRLSMSPSAWREQWQYSRKDNDDPL